MVMRVVCHRGHISRERLLWERGGIADLPLSRKWDVPNDNFGYRSLERLGSPADNYSSASKSFSEQTMHRVNGLGFLLARPHKLAIDLRQVRCSWG